MKPTRSGAKVEVIPWSAANAEDEATRIADTIARLHELGHRYQDMAVLFRSVRTSAMPLVNALESRGIPYTCGGRTGLFMQPEMSLFAQIFAWFVDSEWKDERFGQGQKVDLDDVVSGLSRYFNGGTDGWKTELANRTADAGRKVNPNVLFFSHADGNCADIASHNLYLNFTPLQEREEWLSHWSRRGRLPYQAAEFGAPYFQSWYKDGVFLQTEYTAIYYGEDVYRDEPPDILRRTRPGVYIRRVQSPNYWRFIRDFVWRTNRAWRTFGLNGGLVYFNLEEARHVIVGKNALDTVPYT